MIVDNLTIELLKELKKYHIFVFSGVRTEDICKIEDAVCQHSTFNIYLWGITKRLFNRKSVRRFVDEYYDVCKGYCFLFCEKDNMPILEKIRLESRYWKFVRTISGKIYRGSHREMVKVLKYQNKSKKIKLKEQQKVIVVKGPLIGYRGKIKKIIDELVCVEVYFLNNTVVFYLNLDEVKKITNRRG